MKKINKKIIALLTIAILLSSLIPNLISNAGSNDPTITLVQQEENDLSVGDVVTIALKLSNGMVEQNSLAFFLNYDSTILQYTGFSATNEIANTVLATLDESSSGSLIFAIDSEKNTLGTDGVIAEVKFKILADGESSFSITNAKYCKNIMDGSTASSIDTNISFSTSFSIKTTVLVSGITISPTVANVSVGKTTSLIANVLPANATEKKRITWESDNSGIASVDGTGKVTGVAPGSAKIKATVLADSGNTYTSNECIVTVDNPITSVKMNKESADLENGKQLQLSATIEPNNTTDSKNIVWTSTAEGVASVDDNGLVTALSNGEATITATAGGKSDTCVINVFTKITGLKLDKTTLELNKGDKSTVTALKQPLDATTGGEIKYTSSNPNIVSVNSETGEIEALAKGNATITASAGSYSARCNVVVSVQVEEILIKDSSANMDNIILKKSQSTALTATVLPIDANSKAVTWSSSDENVVSVNNGKITALQTGSATIYATSENGVVGQINVEVPVVNSTELVMSVASGFTMNKDTTRKIGAQLLPEDTTEELDVVWSSSNEDVVEIELDGKVAVLKAVGVGTSTIKATANGHTASIEVSVEIPLASLSISNTSLDMMSGDTSAPLVITKTPEDATVSVSDVVWTSSDENVAKVDETGVVTALSSGKAIIKAKLGSKEVSCTVSVKAKLLGVSIGNPDDKDPLEIVRKQNSIVSVVYNPVFATEIPMANWSIEDETIAEIIDVSYAVTGDKDQITVKGLKAGETNLKVDYGNGVSDTRKIKVTEIPATGVLIETKFEDLAVNSESVPLKANIYPENSSDDLVWTTSDEEIAIITTNDDGDTILKGLKEGEVTVTVTAGNGTYKNSMDVKIVLKKITAIAASIEGKITEGDTKQVNVAVEPIDASEEKVFDYSSSNESVAMIDENGLITALKAGKTTITVEHVNGVKTQFEITVLAKASNSDKPGTNNNTNTSTSNTTTKTNTTATNATTTNTTVTQTVKSTISPATGDINIFVIVGLMIISLSGMIYIIKKR